MKHIAVTGNVYYVFGFFRFVRLVTFVFVPQNNFCTIVKFFSLQCPATSYIKCRNPYIRLTESRTNFFNLHFRHIANQEIIHTALYCRFAIVRNRDKLDIQ